MAYLNQKLKNAIERQDEGAIEQLLEGGADPNAFLSGEDIAPIHLGPGISKSVTSLLLKYGGDVNLRTSDGITPLHIAATWGNKNIVKLLLRNGANIYIRDDEGLTPLDMAKNYEHEKCEIILKRHAHLLKSQNNIKERKVKPPSNPKTKSQYQWVTRIDANFDASQDLFVDSDPEQHLSPVKRVKPRRSVVYRKEIQNQIDHLSENNEDFHLDVTSPDHPSVTPKIQSHISSPKHIRAYTDPVAESTSTPIRPRRSMYTTSVQQTIDKYSGNGKNGQNVNIDVTSPDHPELFFTPSAKSPLNYHQRKQCEMPRKKSLPAVVPFRLEDSSDAIDSSSSESDLYVTVNEAPAGQMSKSPQNALDLDQLKHSMTYKMEQLRNCLNKLDSHGLKPLINGQPVPRKFIPVQDKSYSRTKEPPSGYLPSKKKIHPKKTHQKALGPNHDVDVKFSMEIPPKMVLDNGKSSRKFKHSQNPTIEMNVGENKKSESRKSKREPVIDIQIQPDCESNNINYKVRNLKESDPEIHPKSKPQPKSRGSVRQKVVPKSPEIQQQPGSRVRSKSAHESNCVPPRQDRKEYSRSVGNNERYRQETFPYSSERIYPDQVTYDNQRGSESPDLDKRFYRLTHEDQRGNEKPIPNGRLHRVTQENQRKSETPDPYERIHHQIDEGHRRGERPVPNGRLHRVTHDKQRMSEAPDPKERIHRLTHEDHRRSERPVPNGRLHRVTHENQAKSETPDSYERIRQQMHEDRKGSERPVPNGRLHRVTHEEQAKSETPDPYERILQQMHEDHRRSERPVPNGRLHRLTHDNQRRSESPDLNERIHRLTHENQRSETPDSDEIIYPTMVIHHDKRQPKEIANEYSKKTYVTKPTQNRPLNSSQNITSKNYKFKLSTQNGQLSPHSNMIEKVTARSDFQFDESALDALERQIIPEKSSPVSGRKMPIFSSEYKINDRNSQLKRLKDSSKPNQKPFFMKERSEYEYLNCDPINGNQIFRQRGCMVVDKNSKYDEHQKVAHTSHNERATLIQESAKRDSLLHSQSDPSNTDPSKKRLSNRNRSSMSSVTSTDTYYTCKSDLDPEDFYSCEDGLEHQVEKPGNHFLTILMGAKKKLFHPCFDDVTESSKESSYLREFEFNHDELVQALSEFNLRDPNTSTDPYCTALSNLEGLMMESEDQNYNDFTPDKASCDTFSVDPSQLEYLQSGKPNQEVEESLTPLQYIPARMNNSHYITTIEETGPESLPAAADSLYEEFETAIGQVLLSRSASKRRSPFSNPRSINDPRRSSSQGDSEADNFFLVCVPPTDDQFVSTVAQQSDNISSSEVHDEIDCHNDEPSSSNLAEPDLFRSCIENKNTPVKISRDLDNNKNVHSFNFSQVLSELKRKTELKAIPSQEKTCYRWQPPGNVMNSSQITDESFMNGKGRDTMKLLKKKVGLELKDHPLIKSQKMAIDESSNSRYISAQEDGLQTSQVLPDKIELEAAQVCYKSANYKDRFNEIRLKNITTRKSSERTRQPQSKGPNDSTSLSNQMFSKCDQDDTPYKYDIYQAYYNPPEAEQSCYTSVRRDNTPDVERSCYASVHKDSTPDVERSCYTSLHRNNSLDVERSHYVSTRREDPLDEEQSRYTSIRRDSSPDEEPSRYISTRRDSSPEEEPSRYISTRREDSLDAEPSRYISTRRDSSPEEEQSRYISTRREDSLDAEPSRYISTHRDSSPEEEQSRYISTRREDSLDAEPSRYISTRRDSSPEEEQSRYISTRREDSLDAEPSRYISTRREDSLDAEPSRYISTRRDSSPEEEQSRYISTRREDSLDAEPSQYISTRRDSSPEEEQSRYISTRRDSSPEEEQSRYISTRREDSLDAEPSRYISTRREDSLDAEPSRYISTRRDSSPEEEQSRYISTRRDSSPEEEQSRYISTRREDSLDAEPSQYISTRRDSSPEEEQSRYISTRRDSSPEEEQSRYISTRREDSLDAEPSRYISTHRDSSPEEEPSRYIATRRDRSPDVERSHYVSVCRDRSQSAERSCYPSVSRDSSPDVERSHYVSVRRDRSQSAERSCYPSVSRDSSPDVERSHYVSVRRDRSQSAERSCYTSVRRDSSPPDVDPSYYASIHGDGSPDAEKSCYTSFNRNRSPHTSIKRLRSKSSSRIPKLIDGQLEGKQNVIRPCSRNEPVTLQKRYITPQNNKSLYLSAEDATIYKDASPGEDESKTNFESVVDNVTSSSHWQYLSTKNSAHNRSVSWQNPISTFDEVDACLVESTDDSTSWTPKKCEHSPQTIPMTSTSASDEITSESISSDEFKRCLESKRLLSPEKRTTMWVNGIYKSNMQEYFDADMSSILPVVNSHSSSSDTGKMKCGATAANMKNLRIEPSAPPQSEIINDESYFHSFRCVPTAPPDISNVAVAGISSERSDGLSNSEYISLHPSLYPSLVEPCQNSVIKKLPEPQLKCDDDDNNFEARAVNASTAAYVSFDSEPEPPPANVHCSPENPRALLGHTQKTTKMCSVNVLPSVGFQEANDDIEPLSFGSDLPILNAANKLYQNSKSISTQTPVLRIPPDPPNKFAPSQFRRGTQIRSSNKAKQPQKGWAKLKRFFTGKKIQGQIGDKAFISVGSNQSFLRSCQLTRLGGMSPPVTDSSGTQTDQDIYEPTIKQLEIVKSDEVSLSVNLSEHLSDYSEKYPSSILPRMTVNYQQTTDLLETCSSSGATSGSMERLLSAFCEDSNEDDFDEVDCLPMDTHPIKEDTEEVEEDQSQAVSRDTKKFGETYKTQLSKSDKRRKSNDIEFLHIDPEMQVQFIERRISVENQCDELSDDSENTEIYDWKSFSKSESDDVVDVTPAQPKSVYWRTCGEKPDDVKNNRKTLKKPAGCLSDAELRQTLIDHGLPTPGPVTQTTRQMYLKRLKNASGGDNLACTPSSPDYNAELCQAMNEKVDWTEIIEFEEKMMKKFDDPRNIHKWREGNEKSSFNYLLLDPRVTKNLPSRIAKMTDKLEAFRIFVKSIFYIGKGKRSRPYAHLYEAIKYSQGKNTKANEKVLHILEIWNSGYGVVSLHCFQNVIPVEAYSREACMVDAIGCSNLTNKKRGDFYGLTTSWRLKLKRRMGVYLLHKAMKIFLAEGERQIYPTDLH